MADPPDDGKVVPIRCVEALIDHDTLAAIKHLHDLTRVGDCVGVAFVALLRGNDYTYGYTGAASQHPELTNGILLRLIKEIG